MDAPDAADQVPPAQMAAQLQERREQFGFSYITVLDPFFPEGILAPVIEELAGS